MQNEVDIVADVSGRLDSAGVDYMLTGSMALNFHAEPRATRDIDIVVVMQPGQVDRFVALFESDYYVSRDTVAAATLEKSMFNLIHKESLIKDDCILRKPAAYREAEFARRQRVALGGFGVWIVSKEDLILSKLEWAKDSHSEKQLADVRNLLATGCDEAYLRDWTHKLGLATLLDECLHG